MPVYYSVGLLLVFCVLLVGEFFLPTGGTFGIAALVAAVSAIVIAFTHSATAGLSAMLFVLVSTPFILLMMIRLWPHTPIGRRILNRRPGQLAPDHDLVMPDGSTIGDWVGRIGVAKTDLLPSGMVMIDDQKLDAVSTGMPIDAGSPVIVIKTHGRKLQVRAAREEELAGDQEEPTPVRESSLESLDLESLE